MLLNCLNIFFFECCLVGLKVSWNYDVFFFYFWMEMLEMNEIFMWGNVFLWDKIKVFGEVESEVFILCKFWFVN